MTERGSVDSELLQSTGSQPKLKLQNKAVTKMFVSVKKQQYEDIAAGSSSDYQLGENAYKVSKRLPQRKSSSALHNRSTLSKEKPGVGC